MATPVSEDMRQAVYALGRVGATGIDILGSCFAVGQNLVGTAAHVVDGTDQGLCLLEPRVASIDEYQDTTDSRVNGAPVEIVAIDPIHDVCLLRVVAGSFKSHFELGGTDQCRPGESLLTWGFPHAASGRVVLTQQISTVGARILVGSAGLKVKQLVLNTLAREGQSGSPVFDPYIGNVVALVVGSYSPTTNGRVLIGGVDLAATNQTTQAVSVEYLKRMLP